MQFREQGRKVQCIRSTYDPAVKRSHQKVIAAFDRWAEELPSSELEALTDAERKELAAWFEARQAKRSATRQRWQIQDAPRTLSGLAEAIRAAEALSNEQAAAIWTGLSLVGKALRKAGHPKPKRQGPGDLASRKDP